MAAPGESPLPVNLPWAPGPCCRDANPNACPNQCDKKSPGACPVLPGPDGACVGCATCGHPTRIPTLAACMITRIFDQSGSRNHLHVIGQPDGLNPIATGGRLHKGAPMTGTDASADPLFVDGAPVYSAKFDGGMGFRQNVTSGVAVGNEPETIYMVASGRVYNSGCCFDYGNAEVGTWPNTTNNLTYAKGLMETVGCCCLLPVACCPLPVACCLLPVACCCLLPAAAAAAAAAADSGARWWAPQTPP